MSELTPLTPGSFLKLDDTACHTRLRRLAAEHAQSTPVSAAAPEALARARWESQAFICRQSERLALQELYCGAFTEAYAEARQPAPDAGHSTATAQPSPPRLTQQVAPVTQVTAKAATEPLPPHKTDAPDLSPSTPASATPAAETPSVPAPETPPRQTTTRFEECSITLTLHLLPVQQDTRPVILSAGAQGRTFSIVTATVPASAEPWPALVDTAASLFREVRQQLGRLATAELKRALAQPPARPAASAPATPVSQANHTTLAPAAPATPVPRKQPSLFG
jgi:hypothetical protein